MKKIILIILAVVLAAALAAGGFYGGMAYQRNQSNSVREQFLRSRGLNEMIPGEGPPGEGFAPPTGGGFTGSGVSGEIKRIDGDTITLSTGQNETQITLSENTLIQRTSPGTASDLQTGQQVTVTGRRDEDGSLAAMQVQILESEQAAGNTAP